MKKPHFPDLIQPKDLNHPLYKLVDETLIRGDQKLIALELEVNEPVVSGVKKGTKRSKRIWNKIIEVVIKRKGQEHAFMAYMNTPLPENQRA